MVVVFCHKVNGEAIAKNEGHIFASAESLSPRSKNVDDIFSVQGTYARALGTGTISLSQRAYAADPRMPIMFLVLLKVYVEDVRTPAVSSSLQKAYAGDQKMPTTFSRSNCNIR